MGSTVNYIIIGCIVTDGNYTCGEHGIMCTDVESLCCTSKTNITMCQLYSNLKIKIHRVRE